MKNLISMAAVILVLMVIGFVALPTALASAIFYFGASNLLLCLIFMFLIAKEEN